MDKEISFPHAKINIGLKVTRRLPSGYHVLQSLFYPVDWCDALEVVPQPHDEATNVSCDTPRGCQLTITGIAVDGDTTDNLVSRAYAAVKARFPELLHVDTHLEKRIPFGAGLGGGSSDGAHMLLMLRRMFQLPLSDEEIEMMAAKLGADCAFFCRRGAQYLEGIGPELQPMPEFTLKGYHIVLVKPAVGVSTREAYAHVIPTMPERPLSALLREPIERWRETVVNDFEASVFPVHPELQEIKDQLYAAGAVYASMSGSGSTMFGIFRDRPELSTLQLPDECEVRCVEAQV